MTDARGRALIGLMLLAWWMPQASAEAWAIKSGTLTAMLVGLAAWSGWAAVGRGGRRDLLGPVAACAFWGAAGVLWSLDPVRCAAGALAVGGALLLVAGRIEIAPTAVRWLVIAVAAAESVYAIASQSGLARASGTFVNATHHAAAVAIGAVAVMPFALHGHGLTRRVGLGLLALTCYGVAHSGSRAGLLALAIGLVVALRSGAGRRPTPWRVAGVAAVMLAAILIPSGIRERVSAQVAGGEVSAWDRLAIWRVSAGLALRHPAGVGFGSFGEAFTPVSPRRGVTTDYAHSEPLQVLVEAGWPGVLLAGWMLVAVRRGLHARADPGVAASLAALAVFVLLDFPLHVPYLALAGLMLVIAWLPAPSGTVARVRPMYGALLGAVGAAMMLWLAGLAAAEHRYASGFRRYAADPAGAIGLWEQAQRLCPEYDPPRRALATLRRGIS